MCRHEEKDWFDAVFKNVVTNDGMKSLLFEESVTLAILSICPGGVLLGILGGGVPPGSPNPDPISD